MTPENRIVSELAEAVCKRIARQTRMALTKIAGSGLSGDDSPLDNIWDEICAQCQHENSIFWSHYEDMIRSFVTKFVQKLPRIEVEAVYVQTDDACDLTDKEAEQKHIPINESSVVDFIIQQHVYPLAGDWSNKRIRKYIYGEDAD